jgi:hypothetical protein
MTLVKDAPRTSTSFIIRSDANTRVTASRDPFYELMRRLFQDESTAIRGQRFFVMMPKYPGKILVGDDRRGTGIIRETCEGVNIGMMNRYVQAPYLSPGFGDFDNSFVNEYALNSQN